MRVVLLIALFTLTTPYNIFCSNMCSTGGCNDFTPNGCNNNCQTNWVPSGATCAPNAASGFSLVDKTTDLGGTMTFTPAPGPFVCGPLSTFGTYVGNAVVTIDLLAGVTIPHYQVYAYSWILIPDVWISYQFNTESFILNFTTGPQVKSSLINTRVTSEKYCNVGANRQSVMRINDIYTHSVLNTAMSWTITTNTANTTSLWGLKQFIVVARSCAAVCLTCTGALSTQCQSCAGANVLSNSTCSAACLIGFGATSTANLCVWCSPLCSVCYNLATSCSSCTTFGVNKAYLLGSTCLKTCPAGTYADSATFTCVACTTNCAQCKNTATYCTLCSPGWGWFNWQCYQPCPALFFSSNSGANCTACSLFCQVCATTSTTCTVCTTTAPNTAYLLASNSTCLRVCPTGMYGSTAPNTCLNCDPSCTVCTASPTNCSSCNVSFFYYLDACVSSCPSGFIAYNNTRTCLNYSIYGVSLNISMYFANTANTQLVIDMLYSRPLNYTAFDDTTFQSITTDSPTYPISLFNITYQQTASYYRIIIQPKGFVFMSNVLFTVTTIPLPTPLTYSLDGYPYLPSVYSATASLPWYLVLGPSLNSLQQNIISTLATVSDNSLNLLSGIGAQQIKKTGIFSMLFSGAQITSCAMLTNHIPSQNMYEGTRFWAAFVFHDAPNYQLDTTRPKYILVPSASEVVANSRLLHGRKLFNLKAVEWRFQRTGFTSFFILDLYMPAFLILCCWVGIFIGKCCLQRFNCSRKYMAVCYAVSWRIHQVTIMYVTMAVVLQIIHFDPTSMLRIVSLGLSMLANVYFLFYYLYLYYDFLPYPYTRFGTPRYQYYLMRYGGFLRNLRHQDYDRKEDWSPRHWFRPYNYHLLAYCKKFLMVAAMPLFYDIPYAQLSTLIALQLLQVVRMTVTRPFHSRIRNNSRIFLEVTLLLYFCCNIMQEYLIGQIILNDPTTIDMVVRLFFTVGWIGFAMCFTFNGGFVLLMFIDIILAVRMTAREQIQLIRKEFYYEKVKGVEEGLIKAEKIDVDGWVKEGNLTNKCAAAKDFSLRVEKYKIVPLRGANSSNPIYQVEKEILTKAKMGAPYLKKKRTVADNTIGEKKYGNFRLTEQKNPQFYHYVNGVFQENQGNVESLVVKTFFQVRVGNYKEGDNIEFDRKLMSHKIVANLFSGKSKTTLLSQCLEGFPLKEQL